MLSKLFLFFLALSFAQCYIYKCPVMKGTEASRPSIIQVDTIYYMVTNDLRHPPNSERLYFPVHISHNLENWLRMGYVFDDEHFPPWVRNTSSLYSPVLHYDEREKYYYVFFFATPWGSKYLFQIGAAKSKFVYGPYDPLPEPFELTDRFTQLYPGVMSEGDQTYLLYYSNTGINARRINLSNLTITKDKAVWLLGETEEWEYSPLSGFSYVYKNNYHYILYTNGAGCRGGIQNESAIGVARSKTILGRYKKPNWTLLNTTFTGMWGTAYGTIVPDQRNSGFDAVVYAGVQINTDNCTDQEIRVHTVKWDADLWPYVIKD